VWVPGSRFTTSAILLIDAIAIAGEDAWLRRTGIPGGRLWRAAAVLLLAAGLGIGWCTSFRYANLRSAGVPWPRAYVGFAQRHLAPPGSLAPPPQSPAAAAKRQGASR
jgi:nitroreductase